MSNIILIETSTSLCSTALVRDGKIISYRESDQAKAHASLTTPFIQQMLDEYSLSTADCDAVCVSMGPGSYTGLRVGVSTAKGLCFGGRIPLLAVGTLNVLVRQAFEEYGGLKDYKYVVPMIDARRMEVYCATFSPEGEQLSDTEPVVVEENYFDRILNEGPVLFVGDAAQKCSDVITHPNAHFLHCRPKASAMAALAEKELKEKRFKDLAYFEPFYLKQFIATISKKKLF